MDHSAFIVERIEGNRESRGISIAELARCSGIDKRRLWHILRDGRSLRGDELVRLSLVLGLTLADYVTADMALRLDAVRRKIVEDYGTGTVV